MVLAKFNEHFLYKSLIYFQFSEVLGKLYINQNRFANFEFSVNASTADTELFIRAVCIFSSADDYLEPVKVCYSHSRDSVGNPKSNVCEHLVRCSHPASIYQQDQGNKEVIFSLDLALVHAVVIVMLVPKVVKMESNRGQRIERHFKSCSSTFLFTFRKCFSFFHKVAF